MKTYEVHTHRDGTWWMVEIPELDGLTQAKSLAEVEPMARDYIALVTETAPDSFMLRLSATT